MVHKRITKAIELALSQHEDIKLRIFVQSQDTLGFWQICIIPEKDYKHVIPHIEAIGKHIGQYYGEGLAVEKTKDYIIFS